MIILSNTPSPSLAPTPVVVAQPVVVAPIEPLASISKEKFTAIGKKVDGGETVLLSKLKEIDPEKDFAKIISDGGNIELTSEQTSSLKDFVNNSSMIKVGKDKVASDIATLKTDKHVTADTTKKEITLADGKTKKTVLTGDSGSKLDVLEDKLINPISTDDRERLGIAARQKKIMEVAGKADSLMADIEATGGLSETHLGGVTGSNAPKQGFLFNPVGTLINDTTKRKQYSYGAEEFGNREVRSDKTKDKSIVTKTQVVDPTNSKKKISVSTTTVTPKEWSKTSDAAETTVPKLENHPGTKPVKGDGVKSRVGVWSEADINPRVQEGSTGKAKGRDAERLLFTHQDSEVSDQVSQLSSSSKPIAKKKIDFKYHVTTDHYQTSVPIAPVQSGYKSNNPYKQKYDKTGAEIKPEETPPTLSASSVAVEPPSAK